MKLLKSNLRFLSITLLSVLLFAQCADAKRDALDKIALEINNNLPIQLDMYTSLEKIDVTEEREMKYIYKVTGNEAGLKSEVGRKNIEKNQLLTLSQSADAEPLREAEVTVIHIYNDSEGNELLSIKLTPEQYLNYKPAPVNVHDELQAMVTDAASTLPMQLGENLTFQEMRVAQPDTLEYLYVLEGADKKDFETPDPNHIEALTMQVKTGNDMQAMRSMNVSFRYIYHNEKGEELLNIVITPKDYK